LLFIHVSIRVSSATVTDWKVQNNKTNTVEEAQSTLTVVGAGGCVLILRPFTALDGRKGHCAISGAVEAHTAAVYIDSAPR